MPPLMILAERSHNLRYPVLISTMDPADRQHGGVDDAYRIFTKKGVEEHPQMREHTMTMCNETAVLRKVRKLRFKMHLRTSPQTPQGFLSKDKGVPDEQCHEVAVLENRWPAAGDMSVLGAVSLPRYGDRRYGVLPRRA